VQRAVRGSAGLNWKASWHLDPHSGGEVKLVAGAGQISEPYAFEPVVGFKMSKAHLDALAFIPRFEKAPLQWAKKSDRPRCATGIGSPSGGEPLGACIQRGPAPFASLSDERER
jgi:hypothetical protein